MIYLFFVDLGSNTPPLCLFRTKPKGCGNLTAAQALLHMLPSTQLKALRVPSEDVHDTDSERARMNSIEFMHYLQFFEIWDLFMVVREEQRKEAEQTTRGKKEEWIEGYKVCLLLLLDLSPLSP